MEHRSSSGFGEGVLRVLTVDGTPFDASHDDLDCGVGRKEHDCGPREALCAVVCRRPPPVCREVEHTLANRDVDAQPQETTSSCKSQESRVLGNRSTTPLAAKTTSPTRGDAMRPAIMPMANAIPSAGSPAIRPCSGSIGNASSGSASATVIASVDCSGCPAPSSPGCDQNQDKAPENTQRRQDESKVDPPLRRPTEGNRHCAAT